MRKQQLRVGQKVRVHWLMGDEGKKYSGVGEIVRLTPHLNQVEVRLTEHAGAYECPRAGKTVEFTPGNNYITLHLDSWHPHIRVEPIIGKDA